MNDHLEEINYNMGAVSDIYRLLLSCSNVKILSKILHDFSSRSCKNLLLFLARSSVNLEQRYCAILHDHA